MSLGELAAHAGTGKPAVLRLLHTLEHLGYVSRDADKRYRIGVAWPEPQRQDGVELLHKAAAPFCEQLHREYGETVSLACRFDDLIRVVEVIESPHHVRMSNFKGRILQPYASSLGKSIAAFGDEAERQRLLDVYGVYPLTQKTLVDLHAIQEEFERVCAHGYAEDDEETVDGGYCVGAPIHSPEGAVIASISVSQPKFRVTERIRETLPQAVIDAAKRISSSLALDAGSNS